MAKHTLAIICLTASVAIGHVSRLQAQSQNRPSTESTTATLAELSEVAERQIGRCLTTPSVGEVTVHIRVIFTRHGAASEAHVLDPARMRTDMAYRAMAENAFQAIFICPVHLPPERYAEWRELMLSFGP